jgi:Ca-activated chloride channel family protein
MKDIKTGLIDDGTAIGLGLANCVNRLKDSKADSKIVILLTDGENNTGFIDPITAASIAREKSIKTYTIGVGSYGTAPYPTKDMFGRSIYVDVPANIDEDMLRLVADTTRGMYFRADKKSELAEIYKQIELLQKTEIEELKFYNVTEKYFIFCLLAFICFLLSLLLDYSIFKRIV